jgi:hypothetical protein
VNDGDDDNGYYNWGELLLNGDEHDYDELRTRRPSVKKKAAKRLKKEAMRYKKIKKEEK